MNTVAHCIAQSSVRLAIARHIDVPPSELRSTHHLSRDLGLDPLDLVLVALRLEEGADVEFPIAELESVHTVDDFAELVQAWAEREGRIEGH